jgi:hypothetical protein
MKKLILVLLALIFLLALPMVATAQDEATAEPTAAVTAEATQEAPGGVVINNNTTSTPASSDNTVVIILALMNVGQMGIILAQAIMNNGSVSKKTVDSFFAGLKGLAKMTAWDGDEKLVEAGEKVTNALLGERIVVETTASPGGISPQG